MARTGQPAHRHVAAVSRALLVLDVLAGGEREVGTNEIARRTGINASTVSRLLATLAEGGFVEFVPETARYRLGLRLIQLGNAVLARLDVREVARPHLQALVAAADETATLSVPGDGRAVTVDFVRSPSSVQSVAEVGRPSIAHATATGKVMLSFGGGSLPEGVLTRYTPRTITSRAELARQLDRVRARRWADSTGEREEDLNAIAAPVLGPSGRLVAIIGLQGPASRFHTRAMRAAAPGLLERAAAISALLGG
jgi:IclR family acetate operon transcriptional repressor